MDTFSQMSNRYLTIIINKKNSNEVITQFHFYKHTQHRPTFNIIITTNKLNTGPPTNRGH